MTDQNYIDMEGVENTAVGMINQAKKDFIKGGKLVYGFFHDILSYSDLIKNPKYDAFMHSLTHNEKSQDIRWLYDAWSFVHKDPYDLFEVGEDEVIKGWKILATTAYYRKVYLKLAPKIYMKHVPDKRIQNLPDEELTNYLDSPTDVEKFKEARDYVFKLPNSKELFSNWNEIAWRRRIDARVDEMRRKRPNNNFEAARAKKSKLSETRKARAKELYEAGISRKAIAKELGVQLVTVHYYLRT